MELRETCSTGLRESGPSVPPRDDSALDSLRREPTRGPRINPAEPAHLSPQGQIDELASPQGDVDDVACWRRTRSRRRSRISAGRSTRRFAVNHRLFYVRSRCHGYNRDRSTRKSRRLLKSFSPADPGNLALRGYCRASFLRIAFIWSNGKGNRGTDQPSLDCHLRAIARASGSLADHGEQPSWWSASGFDANFRGREKRSGLSGLDQ